jgi:glycosyltransferase involved in cell wall biosynthesis
VGGARIERVHFAGHVPIPELPRYYAAADVLVLPSHEEVWGLVLNEAAASGLPLVATTVTGASADLIEEGLNGYTVPPGDPACLADAIGKVLQRPEEMGSTSWRIVSDRTYSQNASAILEAIDAALRR